MAALVLLVFHRAIFTDEVFFRRDILTFWLPRVETVVRVVGQGAWPLWDPFEAFGAPLLADPGAQILYPFTWLNLALPPGASYTALVAFHCWFAGLGLARLARAWGAAPLPAFLAGAVWVLSGPFLSLAGMDNHLCGVAWVPWVLVALESALRPSVHGAAGLAAAAAMLVFTGSGDLVLMTALIAAARCLLSLDGAGSWRGAWSRLWPVAAAVPATLALAAAQWLPALELIARRPRGRLARDVSLYWSMHPWSLAEALVPQAFSALPLADTWRAMLYEGREPFLTSVYLGIPALGLVAAGVMAGGRRARLLAAGLAVFVVLGLGRHAMLLPVLLELRPFALIRYPVKYMVPASLVWAMLAAAGAAVWLRPWSPAARRHGRRVAWGFVALAVAIGAVAWWAADDRRLVTLVNAREQWLAPALAPLRWKLAAATGLAAAAGLLAWMRSTWTSPPRWATAALVALVIGDLLAAGLEVNPTGPAALMAARPPVVGDLETRLGPHRIYVEPPPPEWLNRNLVRGPAGWTQEWSLALGLQELVMPPTGARWGLPGSYDGDILGLADPSVAFLSRALPRWRGTPQGLRLLRLGSVGHAVFVRPGELGELVRVSQHDSVFTSPILLARVPDPLPSAYVVGKCRAASADDAPSLLVSPDFEPRREIVADACPSSAAGDLFRGTVGGVSGRPGWHRAEVTAEQPGFLVLVDGYDPGWKATVDGRPAPVLRANLLFQAIPVPEGRHVVECAYRPRAVALGALLSGVAWPAVALAWGWRRPKRRG
jgi:hypothetical protein